MRFMMVDTGHGPRAPERRKEKPRTRHDVQANLEELKFKLIRAEWDVEKAEDELNRAEYQRDDLRADIARLQEELQPLLRPWERPRPKAEQKVTVFVEVRA